VIPVFAVSTLEKISLWQLALFVISSSVISLEVGFRLGQRRRLKPKAEKDSTVNSTVGAVLGLLGFMLAMTFGIALGQFDARRLAFIDEVDAIGTAYLRSDLLNPALRDQAKDSLRRYVQVRLEAVDQGDFKEAGARSEQLHKQLWAITIKAQREATDPISFGLFAQATGKVIDTHTRRVVAAFQSHIPTVIWLVLLGVAIFGMSEVGYQAGLCGSARSPSHLGLAICFTSVLWLVADLDRPREGVIRVNQAAMRELQRVIERERLS
jgi:hypothetical protein